jgi:transcription-repair coupling factor (superfamily II helicase)
MPRPASSDKKPSPNSGFAILSGVPEGAQPLAVRHALSTDARPCLFITHHDRQLSQFMAAAPFFLPPNVPVIAFPAWDTLPYDRSAPARAVVAARVAALAHILQLKKQKLPFVVATTSSAFLQKLPPVSTFAHASFSLKVGERIAHDELVFFLSEEGYRRASRVMEAGEFAVRGSIIDIFPANAAAPYRLDLFGDMIESIKTFDALTQRTEGAPVQELAIVPTSELLLNDTRIEHFRKAYRELFGQPSREDALYHTVSEGNYYAGMEHWLPLFYDRLETLLDYLPDAQILMDHGLMTSLEEREEIIHDYYSARNVSRETRGKTSISSAPYHPVPPDSFFLTKDWKRLLAAKGAVALEMFESEHSLGLRGVKKLHAISKSEKRSAFELMSEEVAQESRPILLTAHTQGSRERLEQLLKEQHLPAPRSLANWGDILTAKAGLYSAETPLGAGFQGEGFIIYTEEDLLGRRIIQTRKRKSHSEAFLAEAAAFEVDELLVHTDHGIGRFDGLVTLEVNGKRHDCLKIVYRDDDRLFIPVENLDLITRHGGEAGDVALDKLGAGSWQVRKAAYKEKLRLTAEELLRTAAARELCTATTLSPIEELYSDFTARFPYDTTEDQQRAIDEVIDDLQGNKPMDRLVCGDVGFGKTEVAIRAAFIAATDAINPVQVAFIAPTTLLVRQHYHNFLKRFEETGLSVAQLSRLCTAKEAKRVKEGIADGNIDIVIGTHALLAESIQFKNLGFLIIDEEQRFGVKQKEGLKKLKSDIHVLTMSATPIPRTLQMALTGVRELSLITTPPVDRLAIRSFVQPFDPLVMREAIKRELHRGGQVFYVTPRIADLAELKARILELVPEVRLGVAHGQMSAQELDSTMNEVYDGKYDVLLSTAIIESGIDIPTANTIIINRADRFGLAQLYQLRGRVGRGKTRAYAYFTLPYHGAMTPQAVKRLEVMQTLDTLGAGFTLASHDMDIRGFGNLVGEEQSGHVKDIGIELYQHMLAEAVKHARVAQKSAPVPEAEMLIDDDWSPQLNLGLSVLIPEEYVEDVSLRLSLYRRAATLTTAEEIESFAAELSDRFGELPEEVEHLFTTLKLKQTCKRAGIARVDTGPKGVVINFHAAAITNPTALMGYIAKHSRTMKLRPDQSLFRAAEWTSEKQKLNDVKQLVESLSELI